MTKNRRRRKKQDKSNSWFGNVLLEMVAVVAFLLALSVTNGVSDPSVNESKNYEISDVPAAITGYLSDRISLQIKN